MTASLEVEEDGEEPGGEGGYRGKWVDVRWRRKLRLGRLIDAGSRGVSESVEFLFFFFLNSQMNFVLLVLFQTPYWLSFGAVPNCRVNQQ